MIASVCVYLKWFYLDLIFFGFEFSYVLHTKESGFNVFDRFDLLYQVPVLHINPIV